MRYPVPSYAVPMLSCYGAWVYQDLADGPPPVVDPGLVRAVDLARCLVPHIAVGAYARSVPDIATSVRICCSSIRSESTGHCDLHTPDQYRRSMLHTARSLPRALSVQKIA
eukprot:3511000-Rhodomonas_salina.2